MMAPIAVFCSWCYVGFQQQGKREWHMFSEAELKVNATCSAYSSRFEMQRI